MRLIGSEPPEPARLLIVDDSAFARKMLRKMFAGLPDIVVAGEAEEGREALDAVEALSPAIVTLDLEMPGMNGLSTLRALREIRPDLPVLILASSAAGGAAAALEALSSGAFDFIDKAAFGPMEFQRLGPQILAKARAALQSHHAPAARAGRGGKPPAAAFPSKDGVLCIGASTGGPPAIQRLLEALPASFPLPVAIVQHMPAGFTAAFAERLDRFSRLTVKEAEEGDEVRPGRVLVARAGSHLLFARGARGTIAHLSKNPPDALHIPSLDVLFTSAAETFGASAVGVVLTGMGADGREGARALAGAGAFVVAEAEETCAVYGMPKALVDAGLARAVWPLDELAGRLAAIGVHRG